MALLGTEMPRVAREWSRMLPGGQWKQPPACLGLCCVIYVVTQTQTSTWKPPKLRFPYRAAARAQGMFWSQCCQEAEELKQGKWENGAVTPDIYSDSL